MKGETYKAPACEHREPGVRNLGEVVFQEEGLARAKGQVETQNTVLGNDICHGG